MGYLKPWIDLFDFVSSLRLSSKSFGLEPPQLVLLILRELHRKTNSVSTVPAGMTPRKPIARIGR